MKETWTFCSGENEQKQRHGFGTDGGPYFRNLKTCHYKSCGCPMKLEEVEIRARSGAAERAAEAWGYMRGQAIDKLKRLPWYPESLLINDPKQKRSNMIWTLKEAKELAKLYHVRGNNTAKVWKDLATWLGRSLASVERQLRIIRDFKNELGRWYPDF